MSFSPDCIRSQSKPVVFLLNSFLKTPNIGNTGDFSAYPPDVKDSFNQVINKSFSLLFMRDSQDAQSRRGVPLFEIRRINSLSDVPTILNVGDIVAGFDHTPPYEVASIDNSITYPPASDEARISRFVLERFKKSFREKFEQKFSTKLLPSSNEKIEEAGDMGGFSDGSFFKFEATRRTGGAFKGYFHEAVSIVNIASPAIESLYVYTDKSIIEKAKKILKEGQFDIPSVKKVADSCGVSKKIEYLKAVGRGLAYSLLHEFWHNATGESQHPSGSGGMIERGPHPRFMDPKEPSQPMSLLENSVNKIITRYEKNWCGLSLKRIKNIDAAG